MTETEYQHPMMVAYWAQLDTRFKPVEEVFEDLMAEALAILTREDIYHYLDAARVIGKLGRGVEPMLAFMEEWPSVVQALGEEAVLSEVMAFVMKMQKSPNGKAITPFLQTIAPVARKQHSREQMRHYIEIADDLMTRTTGSIHGHHTTFPSPGLPEFFQQAPFLFGMLSMGGVRNWVEYGIRNYRSHPERQIDYFSLQSADARAVLQRERHGTLFADVERKLDLYLRGLWQDSDQLVPYSTAFDELRKPIPYYDKLGMRVPDVFDDMILPLPHRGRYPEGHEGWGVRVCESPASTATAPCSPTWSVTGAGRRPSSPTTTARSSAWRSSSSKTAGSRTC
jgi:nitric oxide reductase NorD protein